MKKPKVVLSREVKVQMDPNSPEWLARLEQIKKNRAAKYGVTPDSPDNEPTHLVTPGYRNGDIQSF